jgi:hypothetical protein
MWRASGTQEVDSAINAWGLLAPGLKATGRNRWAWVSLSPTLTLFLAPHGQLYLRLQDRVPESESVRLVASTPPKTMASSIAIPEALLQATASSKGNPK